MCLLPVEYAEDLCLLVLASGGNRFLCFFLSENTDDVDLYLVRCIKLVKVVSSTTTKNDNDNDDDDDDDRQESKNGFGHRGTSEASRCRVRIVVVRYS